MSVTLRDSTFTIKPFRYVQPASKLYIDYNADLIKSLRKSHAEYTFNATVVKTEGLLNTILNWIRSFFTYQIIIRHEGMFVHAWVDSKDMNVIRSYMVNVLKLKKQGLYLNVDLHHKNTLQFLPFEKEQAFAVAKEQLVETQKDLEEAETYFETETYSPLKSHAQKKLDIARIKIDEARREAHLLGQSLIVRPTQLELPGVQLRKKEQEEEPFAHVLTRAVLEERSIADSDGSLSQTTIGSSAAGSRPGSREGSPVYEVLPVSQRPPPHIRFVPTQATTLNTNEIEKYKEYIRSKTSGRQKDYIEEGTFWSRLIKLQHNLLCAKGHGANPYSRKIAEMTGDSRSVRDIIRMEDL